MLSASISSLQASVSKNRVHRRHVLASNPPLKVSSLPESLLQASNESSPRPGHVYVVGGGLGPVDHLTVSMYKWNIANSCSRVTSPSLFACRR